MFAYSFALEGTFLFFNSAGFLAGEAAGLSTVFEELLLLTGFTLSCCMTWGAVSYTHLTLPTKA